MRGCFAGIKSAAADRKLMSGPGRLRDGTRLGQHGIARAIGRGHLAGDRHRQTQLLARNRIDAHRRSQRRDFQMKLLIQFRSLGATRFELLDLIAQLHALKMLPGI